MCWGGGVPGRRGRSGRHVRELGGGGGYAGKVRPAGHHVLGEWGCAPVRRGCAGGEGDALVRQGWSGHRVVRLSGEAGRPPCGGSGALVRPSCA